MVVVLQGRRDGGTNVCLDVRRWKFARPFPTTRTVVTLTETFNSGDLCILATTDCKAAAERTQLPSMCMLTFPCVIPFRRGAIRSLRCFPPNREYAGVRGEGAVHARCEALPPRGPPRAQPRHPRPALSSRPGVSAAETGARRCSYCGRDCRSRTGRRWNLSTTTSRARPERGSGGGGPRGGGRGGGGQARGGPDICGRRPVSGAAWARWGGGAP